MPDLLMAIDNIMYRANTSMIMNDCLILWKNDFVPDIMNEAFEVWNTMYGVKCKHQWLCLLSIEYLGQVYRCLTSEEKANDIVFLASWLECTIPLDHSGGETKTHLNCRQWNDQINGFLRHNTIIFHTHDTAKHLWVFWIIFLQNAVNRTTCDPLVTQTQGWDAWTSCRMCKHCCCSYRCRSRECRSSYQKDRWLTVALTWTSQTHTWSCRCMG